MPRLRPNTFKEIYCTTCGTLNNVKRSQKGPTSWGGAMAGIESVYDEFNCPHHDEPWHQEAVKLKRDMDETTSQKVRRFYQQDFEEILAEHGCKLPESGEFLVVIDEIKQMKQNIVSNGMNYITIETAWRGDPSINALYFFDERFYVILPEYDHEDDLKDYLTFAEAFANPMLNRIDQFTISIISEVFSVDEIMSMMKSLIYKDKTILINGEEVRISGVI